MLFKALNKKDLTLLTSRRSQSALEYMMTYGWAILIIVIVAVILYSMGIFNPSSSITTTITGFQSLGVTQAACINSVNNQILELYVTNNVGYPINLTKINVTGNNGVTVTQDIGSLLSPGHSSSFYVNGACNKSSSSYSGSVTITYMEVGQPLPGPYISTGKITNLPSSINANKVAYFNGVNSLITTSRPFLSKSFTIVYWVNAVNTTRMESGSGYSMFGASGQNYISLWLNNGGSTGASCDSGDEEIGINNSIEVHGFGISGSTWNMVVISISDGLVHFFVNSTGPCVNSLPTGAYSLGDLYFATSEADIPPFNGKLSNVEVYSSILSNNQVSSLYLEGQGGAPIPNAGLVDWWPLDGNANDYSANNNNGVATNVNWVSP